MTFLSSGLMRRLHSFDARRARFTLVEARNPSSNRAGYRHTEHWNRKLISRRRHMTKLFPFARVLTLGSVGVAVTLCVCLQLQTSAQPAERQQEARPPSNSAARAVTPASNPLRLLG